MRLKKGSESASEVDDNLTRFAEGLEKRFGKTYKVAEGDEAFYTKKAKRNKAKVVVGAVLVIATLVGGYMAQRGLDRAIEVRSDRALNKEYTKGGTREPIRETRNLNGRSPLKGQQFVLWDGEKVTGGDTAQYWELGEEYEKTLCERYNGGDASCLYNMVAYVGEKDGYKDYAYMASEGSGKAFSVAKKNGKIYENRVVDWLIDKEYGCQTWGMQYGVAKVFMGYNGGLVEGSTADGRAIWGQGGTHMVFLVPTGVDGGSVVREWAKKETESQYLGGDVTITVGNVPDGSPLYLKEGLIYNVDVKQLRNAHTYTVSRMGEVR